MKSVTSKTKSLQVFYIVILVCAALASVSLKVNASSVVGINGNGSNQQISNQRKTFYANGRHWVFASNGTYPFFTSSLTGNNGDWMTAQVLTTTATITSGSRFSVWFNGSKFAYAIGTGTTKTLLFRMGVPNNDGSITWTTSEQSVSVAVNAYVPYVSFDSSGYPWISFFTGTYPYVVKSDWNNGSWSTSAGFPIQLSTSSGAYYCSSVVPLQSQQMYVAYTKDNALAYGKLWNGTAFESEETIINSNVKSPHSLVSNGTDVYIACVNYTSGDTGPIQFNQRSSGTWGTVQNLGSPTALLQISLAINQTNANLYVVTGPASGLAYLDVYNGSAWSGWAAGESISASTWSLTLDYEVLSSRLGCMWNDNVGLFPIIFCEVLHHVNLKAIDASGNSATNSNVTVAFPTGSQTVNVTSTGWANYTLTYFGGFTSLVSVEFQDVNVYSESVTFNVSSTVDISCAIYSLQVNVEYNTGDRLANIPLELLRDSTSINGLYNLAASPESNSTGSYCWEQLAGNQTYTIETGKGYSMLTLTSNNIQPLIYMESGSDIPSDVSTKQYMVEFIVKANNDPCENCQIQIYASDSGDFFTKQMTGQDGKASFSLVPGEYEYRASWMKDSRSGSWVHIEDTIIKLDFSSAVDEEKPVNAVRVLVGSCVVVGAIVAMVKLGAFKHLKRKL